MIICICKFRGKGFPRQRKELFRFFPLLSVHGEGCWLFYGLLMYICFCFLRLGKFLTNYADGNISREMKHNGEEERPKGCNPVHKYRINFGIRHDP